MLIFVLISLTLVTTAVLGGGIFPFTIAVLATSFSIACLLIPANQKDSVLLPLLSGILVLILLATYIPLPSGLAANFGSKLAHQNLLAEKAINRAVELSIIKHYTPLFSITRNRAGTARIILLIIAGIAIAALASRMPENWKERYILFLLLFVTALAVLGFISQWIIPQEKNIWWIFPVPHGRPVGCFINRNHFGGFVALFSAPAVFLAAGSIEKKRYLQTILYGLCFTILCITVIMSLSKGAWFALAISMLFALVVLLLRKQWLSTILLSASIIIAVWTLIVIPLPSRQLNERLESLSGIVKNQSVEMRMSTWRDSYAILRDYPFTGTGANAFRMVFPQYRLASTRKPFEHAENEYVQIPVEFGIPTSVVIIAIMICIASKWRSTLLTEKNMILTLCVAGVLVAVATHALTDFAIRIPLYFLTVCSMIGLVLSPSQTEPCKKTGNTGLGMLLPTGALIITVLLCIPGKGIYEIDSSDYFETATNDKICRALTWNPTSWHAWYYLGKVSVALKTDDACRFGEKCLTQAASYDPRNYLVWEELTLLRMSLQDIDGAREANRRLKELRPWKQITELEIQPPSR